MDTTALGDHEPDTTGTIVADASHRGAAHDAARGGGAAWAELAPGGAALRLVQDWWSAGLGLEAAWRGEQSTPVRGPAGHRACHRSSQVCGLRTDLGAREVGR